MRDYTKIDAWKLADDLTVGLYERTRTFPREETYGLTSQLRRAAYSVPANIAEGASRESKRDYLHFLYIARGSLSETQYFVHLARRLGYLETAEAEQLMFQTKQTFACLHGLTRAVERETGKFGKILAAASSLLVVSLVRWGQWSLVSGQWS
jgi:four helix bundle protein